MNRVLPIILGPTAVGKTSLSLMLAGQLQAQIISADSRQIYRYMNIGTAKPAPAELKLITHHFIDILDPDRTYSAGIYSESAREKIRTLFETGIQPLVVGGSGLYIQALSEGFFGQELKDDAVRRQLELEVVLKGLPELYAELGRIDLTYQLKISPNDQKRILRALEVYRVSGRPFSAWHSEQPKPAGFQPLYIGLTLPREILIRKIEQRAEQMIESGLVDEVRDILNRGFSPDLNALNTVSYTEIIDHLQGRISLKEALELIRIHTRQYAKRQMTWFRKNQKITWFDLSGSGDEIKILNYIRNRIFHSDQCQ